MEILVSDMFNKVIIGNRDSNGNIEYLVYKVIASGNIGNPDSDIGAILASDAGFTTYQDYILSEIK